MPQLKNILLAASLAVMTVVTLAHAAVGDAMLQGPEVEAVTKLNENYFRSWREYDMDWYRQNLAEHFVLIASDGSVFDKKGFVSLPSQRENIHDARIDDVVVRVYPGGTAVVTAICVVNYKNGQQTATRYTDVYTRINGQWKAVSAQLTADKNFKPNTVMSTK